MHRHYECLHPLPSQSLNHAFPTRCLLLVLQVPLSYDFASLIPPEKQYTLRDAIRLCDQRGYKASATGAHVGRQCSTVGSGHHVQARLQKHNSAHSSPVIE